MACLVSSVAHYETFHSVEKNKISKKYEVKCCN